MKVKVQSRNLDPQVVYKQWFALLQQRQQDTQKRYEEHRRLHMRAKEVSESLRALAWLQAESQRYPTPQTYPDFRHECEYVLERLESHSLRKLVEHEFHTLHQKLVEWAEQQFDAEYRYEVQRDPDHPGCWVIWDRQIQRIDQTHRHSSHPLSSQSARRWVAGLNGLAFCSSKDCRQWTPHQCLPMEMLQCQVCLTERPITSAD